MNSIGIIGAGNIGRAFATALASNNIRATLANSRGPDSLKEVVAAIGPTIEAGTREEAASKDIVLVAVNWSKIPAALAGLPDFGGRIVIDANNPIEAPLFRLADLSGRASSEVFASLVPGARGGEGVQPPPTASSRRRSDGRRRAPRAVLFRRRCTGEGAGRRSHRPSRLLRNRSWLARDRYPPRAVPRWTASPALNLVKFA
jgi:hypothetical protein